MSGSSATSGSRPAGAVGCDPGAGACRWSGCRPERLADLPGGQRRTATGRSGSRASRVQAGIGIPRTSFASWLALRRPASAASIVSVSPVVVASSGKNDRCRCSRRMRSIARLMGGPDDPRLRIARQPEAPGVHALTSASWTTSSLGERRFDGPKDLRQRADQVRVLLAEQVLDQLRRRCPQRALRHESSDLIVLDRPTSTEPPNS